MEIDDLIVRRALDALKGLLTSPNNNAARVLARLAAENLADCLPENAAKAAAEVIAKVGNHEPIPDGVYYSWDIDNFYCDTAHRGMGTEFYSQWRERREEFPAKHELQDHLGCSRDIVGAMSAEDAIVHYASRHGLSSSQLSHWRAVRR